MMANKWVQAVLFGGVGFGLLLGSLLASISGAPLAVILVGFLLMVVGLWKTANCRGTDGWGGPYHGPSNTQQKR